mmetsp:Transcript_63705/g.87556  ORF Transcript_63705/g.87556 Transcript_63705/m.87556 type:complete len:81 (+) Transcript_63705:51-293(+)
MRNTSNVKKNTTDERVDVTWWVIKDFIISFKEIFSSRILSGSLFRLQNISHHKSEMCREGCRENSTNWWNAINMLLTPIR